MVAPEREVPGNTAAISWKIPMMMAVGYVIWLILRICGLLYLFVFSMIMKRIPNRISMIATVI